LITLPRPFPAWENHIQQQEFVRKSSQYYQHTDLTNPEVDLDWVNDTGWESEIYAYTLTCGGLTNKRLCRWCCASASI